MQHVPPAKSLGVWLCGLLTFVLAACGSKLSYQAMAQQPRYESYEASVAATDQPSARPLPEGVLPRGHVEADTLLYTGKSEGADAEVFPFPITREVLERGQERYTIYCTPCHDAVGTGQGLVVQRGFSPPPSFHTDRLRQAPVGHFFDVITNGFGAMPGYAEQVSVNDRWAIIAYLRALQLSQNATLNDVPDEARPQLEAATPPP